MKTKKRVLARKKAQELNMEDLQKVGGAGADKCQGTTQKITGNMNNPDIEVDYEIRF